MPRLGMYINTLGANRQSHYENLQPGPVKGSGGCREAADIHLPGAADRSGVSAHQIDSTLRPCPWRGEGQVSFETLLLQRFKSLQDPRCQLDTHYSQQRSNGGGGSFGSLYETNWEKAENWVTGQGLSSVVIGPPVRQSRQTCLF